jgi:hypothetical protein
MIRKDTETKNLRKTILKFSKDIPVVGERHRGVFSITGYRVYDNISTGCYVEVDAVFKGEIKVSVSSIQGEQWFESDIKKNEKYKVSPVRLGRFLRNRLFKDINSHICYFDSCIKNEYAIKTIKWM